MSRYLGTYLGGYSVLSAAEGNLLEAHETKPKLHAPSDPLRINAV